MNRVTVIAYKWDDGWELEVDNDHHTQVRTLNRAKHQVIDYLDTTWPEVDHSGSEVEVIPDIPQCDSVMQAREATREAAEATIRAAELSRSAASGLRNTGISVTDAAAIMGVSRGRISRLTE